MLRTSLVALLAFASTPAWAGAKVDPQVHRVIRTGVLGGMQRLPRVPGQAKVLVELGKPVDDAAILRLEQQGVIVSRANGVALHYGRFVVASVDATSIAKLEAMPEVVHVASAGQRGPMPLDMSAKRMRLADARGSRPATGDLTGKGVVIADSDSAVDPFQPTFFKGDGGYYAWIDVDGDGIFTPGIDAIDLNANGAADAGEVATLLEAKTCDFYGSAVAARTSKTFDPGVDWVYLDTNSNAKRDYGAAGGFTDATPALGEPLFTPDDVDRSGKIEVGEKFVRLGTSKFKLIRAELGAPWNVDTTWTRGTDLSATTIDFTNSELYGYADAMHATGVNTILVGDVPLVGRRWVGIAPEADVIVSFDGTESLPIAGVMWMLMQNPDVALYELAPWTGFPLDGTDPLSQLIDASSTTVAHTCPTGDQGSALKHAHVAIAAGATTQLPFDLPAMAKEGTTPLSYVEVSLNVRGGAATAVKLTGPKGDSYDLTMDPQAPIMDGGSIYATHDTSSRGTTLYDAILYLPQGAPTTAALDVGTWTATVTAGSTLTVDAYVSDDQSSWAVGAAWDASIATDVSTVGVPSVADSCIAVNAYADHLDTDGTESWYDMYYAVYDVPASYQDTEDTVRAYSPRGPRIDGVQKPDITAPDNPWVQMTSAMGPYGAFDVFGGTSGASPHVTGTAALLVQAGMKGLAVRDAIRSGANKSTITGLPNGDYGYGLLDAAGALGVTTPGEDFTVTVTVTPTMATVKHTKLVVTATGPDATATAGLEAKWDDGYDGTWDTDYSAAGLNREIPLLAPGTYVGKVRVRNAAGHVAEALVTTDVSKAKGGRGCDVGGAPTDVPPLGLLTVAGLLLSLHVLRRRSRCGEAP